jgi:hypothetical protein
LDRLSNWILPARVEKQNHSFADADMTDSPQGAAYKLSTGSRAEKGKASPENNIRLLPRQSQGISAESPLVSG